MLCEYHLHASLHWFEMPTKWNCKQNFLNTQPSMKSLIRLNGLWLMDNVTITTKVTTFDFKFMTLFFT